MKNDVLTVTRVFDHRVKMFIKHIILGKNQPMNVKHYSYRVEFQAWGFGHVHGVLWCSLSNPVREAFTKIFSTSSVDAFASMAIRTSYSSIAQFYYLKKSAYSFVMWIRTGLGGKAVGGVGAIWLHYYFGRKSTVDKIAWGDNRLDNSQCWWWSSMVGIRCMVECHA